VRHFLSKWVLLPVVIGGFVVWFQADPRAGDTIANIVSGLFYLAGQVLMWLGRLLSHALPDRPTTGGA
jgi:hypothetical protein